MLRSPPVSPLREASITRFADSARLVLGRLDATLDHDTALDGAFPPCYNSPLPVRAECEKMADPKQSGALPAIMFDGEAATPTSTKSWAGSYAFVTPSLFRDKEVVCKFTFLKNSNTPVFDVGMLCNEVLKLDYINEQLALGLDPRPREGWLSEFEVAVPKQLHMGCSRGGGETMFVQVLTSLGAFDESTDGPMTGRAILQMATDQAGRRALLEWKNALVGPEDTLSPEDFAAQLVVQVMTAASACMAGWQLSHGDLNARNVALDVKLRRICIIDFQFCRYESVDNVEYRVPHGDTVCRVSPIHQLADIISPWIDDFYSWAWLVELAKGNIMAARAAHLYVHPNLPKIEKDGGLVTCAPVMLHCFKKYARQACNMREPLEHYYAHSVFFDQLDAAHLRGLLDWACKFGWVSYTRPASITGNQAHRAFDALVRSHR